MPHASRHSRGDIPSGSMRSGAASPAYSTAPSMPESRQYRPSILDEQYMREPELDEHYGTPSHWINAMKQQQANQSEQQTLASHKRARLNAKVRQLNTGNSKMIKPTTSSRFHDSDGPALSVDPNGHSTSSTRPTTTSRPATTRSSTRPTTVHSRVSQRPYTAQIEEKMRSPDDELMSDDVRAMQSMSQSAFLTATDDTEQMSIDDSCDEQEFVSELESSDVSKPVIVPCVNPYDLFVHSRVRHMLIKNYVFVEKNGDAFVSTKRDRIEARHTNVSPFHLPSLQCDSQNYKSSSASIELAGPDEQSLYSLIFFLSRIPLFHALPLSAFISMAQHLHLQTFDEYEVICAEGEPNDFLYFVHKGRVDVKLNINNAAATESSSQSTNQSTNEPPREPDRDLFAMALSAETVVTQAPTQKRRFHSMNSASLDIACLGTHDIAGDSALITGKSASSVIAVTAVCECYAIHAQNLFVVLRDYPTLQSLLSYITYSSLLRQRHAVVRDRYRSSYTSAVKFSLFVDGSLRRNLSHRNQRRKLVREAIGVGANHSNVTSLIDQHAHAQIAHTQKFERSAKRAKLEAEKRRYGLVAALDSSEDDAELAELTTIPMADRIRRKSLIATAPEFQVALLTFSDDDNVVQLPRLEATKSISK